MKDKTIYSKINEKYLSIEQHCSIMNRTKKSTNKLLLDRVFLQKNLVLDLLRFIFFRHRVGRERNELR